jgi:NADP-dependent 3-hydroxy acid dehydrogenase YdfG
MALVARRRDRLDKVAATIVDTGGTALVLEADLTDTDQATEAVSRAVHELGRLDIVVNAAGVLYPGPVSEAPAEEWEQMIAINVGGVLNVIRAALPHLVAAAGRGPRRVADLVNISSTGGRVARPGTGVYSLTKFGVNALSESLRQELLPNRVRVSLVEPGTVDTELASHTREELKEGIAQMTRSIELLRPEDIAEAVTYIVTRDRRVAVNEILIRAGEQTW